MRQHFRLLGQIRSRFLEGEPHVGEKAPLISFDTLIFLLGTNDLTPSEILCLVALFIDATSVYKYKCPI